MPNLDLKPSNKLSDWLDKYWPFLLVAFGIAFVLFLDFFKPHNGWANY